MAGLVLNSCLGLLLSACHLLLITPACQHVRLCPAPSPQLINELEAQPKSLKGEELMLKCVQQQSERGPGINERTKAYQQRGGNWK